MSFAACASTPDAIDASTARVTCSSDVRSGPPAPELHAGWLALARQWVERLGTVDGPALPTSDEAAFAFLCPGCDPNARAWLATIDGGAARGFGIGWSAVVTRAGSGLAVVGPEAFQQIGRCGMDVSDLVLLGGAAEGERGMVVFDVGHVSGEMIEDPEYGTSCFARSLVRSIVAFDPERLERGLVITQQLDLASPGFLAPTATFAAAVAANDGNPGDEWGAPRESFVIVDGGAITFDDCGTLRTVHVP